MLYKNDVRISLSNTSDREADHARGVLQELRKFATAKGIVRFKTRPNMKNPAIFIPLFAQVRTPKGMYTMRYANSVVKKGDNIIYNPPNIHWPRNGVVDINRDPELAVFLYGYSTLCLNGLNPHKSNVCWFLLEDREAEARTKVSSRLSISKITNLILSPTDEGGIPIKLLLNYGKSKNLPFSPDDTEVVIRSKIFEYVDRNNKHNDFNSSLAGKRYSEYSDVIDKAIEYGVIRVMRHNDNQKAWRFISKEGKFGEYIRKLPVTADARGHLLDELENDEFLLQKIKEVTMERIGEVQEDVPDKTPYQPDDDAEGKMWSEEEKEIEKARAEVPDVDNTVSVPQGDFIEEDEISEEFLEDLGNKMPPAVTDPPVGVHGKSTPKPSKSKAKKGKK